MVINKRTEIAKIEDRQRPANHWVVGMMTGVMGVAAIKQIRKAQTKKLWKLFTLAPDRRDGGREAQADGFPP